ncbi:MAG: sulfite exporter TauE/SafE family protein [Pseudomonadota bacterium]
MQALAAIASGSVVGLSLGLIGGGGSILAVPLLIYVVGMPSVHAAIGTSAVAVAASAAVSLIGHARARNVRWRCAIVFALSGIAGASGGAQLGKMMDGGRLLALFGMLMIVVGAAMLRRRQGGDDAGVRLDRTTAPRLLPVLVVTGFGVGLLSGFFGIGGGFLIVPGLIGATAMPMLDAIGSSLVSVTLFGATTATSYALSGLVEWRIAGLFVLGGAVGGMIGLLAAGRLAAQKRALTYVFAAIVMSTGLYVVVTSLIGQA